VERGPVLLVTGATHGTEITGTRALLRLIPTLDPTKMKGTLIAVPVTNPLAFDRSSYGSPEDGVHMGQPCYWPAQPDGTATQRIGAAIRPLLDVATHYIDLHNNREPALPMSMEFFETCSNAQVRIVQREMAAAFGLTSVRMAEPDDDTARRVGSMDGQPAAASSAQGVPGLMVELLDQEGYRGEDVGIVGVRNVMSYLGMLADPIQDQDTPVLEGAYTFRGILRAQKAGVLFPLSPPGTLLNAGDAVAEVVDMTGRVIEVVRMPVDGFVWAFLESGQGIGTMAVPEGHSVGFFASRD
jgi:predicted deacylase